MTALADFADWPLQTVTWKKVTGRDQYGAPTYGAGTTAKAYVLPASGEDRQLTEERMVNTAIIILTAPDLTPEDQLTLPDNSTPVLAYVERVFDEKGQPYYTKVLCGATGRSPA